VPHRVCAASKEIFVVDSIFVRLVPRSEGALSMNEMSTASATQGSSRAAVVKPTRKSMNAGMKALSDRKMAADTSALDRLTVEMSQKEFSDMFGAPVLQKRQTRTPKSESVTIQDDYQSPKKALVIPDALKASIAFAYVPKPVEFHAAAPHFLSPFEANYHLTLQDVASLLNAERCHRNGWTGKGVKVAMADSGFFLHPHFVRNGYKLVPTESPGSGDPTIDDSGHGTGEAANIFAIAPDCTVFGVKHGSSTAGTLEACIALSPDVMTNSWGWDVDRATRPQLETSDPNFFLELVDVENVLTIAHDRGITVCFSAGNGHFSFPASFPKVIAAGGVTANEGGSFVASSYASGFKSQIYPGREVPDFCGIVGESGPEPMNAHIMLPVPIGAELDGDNFKSKRKKLGWGIFSGTSAASPQLAGVIALMKGIDRSLKPEQIRQLIAARCVDITSGKTATGESAGVGRDVATGTGLVDALRVCSQLATS
jgi:serine protease AprX